MITLPAGITCAVCNKGIDPDKGWIYHQRLGVYVCFGCPKNDVCGEDITTHTLFYAFPKEAS